MSARRLDQRLPTPAASGDSRLREACGLPTAKPPGVEKPATVPCGHTLSRVVLVGHHVKRVWVLGLGS